MIFVGAAARLSHQAEANWSSTPNPAKALRILQERFGKDHPFPPRGDEEKGIAWSRTHLAAVGEWLKTVPDDPSLLFDVVSDLKELPETKPEEFTAAADRFQTAYAKDANFLTTPPLEWTIAGAYIKIQDPPRPGARYDRRRLSHHA